MKIRKSKYPAITTEEEAISVPLQTLCVAIFDAILVNMMNTIDKKNWQPLREDMCNRLNKRKNERTMQILEVSYASADIQFLQEVAGSFADAAKKKPLSSIFNIHYPSEMDADRDQNSFILLKKDRFKDVVEVTSSVLKELDGSKDVPLAKGDLLALTCTDAEDGTKYLLASFHGDTNGLATIPVVTAVHSYAVSKVPDHKLLFGMDANTYATPEADQQGVVAFAQFYRSKSLNSCYGPYPNPKNFTTFHARTHLQPQLNKAVKLEEKDIKGDKNPKDFIVFFAADYEVLSTEKDNTGERKYVENMVFPTLDFPSDHGVTSTVLVEHAGASHAHTVSGESENAGTAGDSEDVSDGDGNGREGDARAPPEGNEEQVAETSEPTPVPSAHPTSARVTGKPVRAVPVAAGADSNDAAAGNRTRTALKPSPLSAAAGAGARTGTGGSRNTSNNAPRHHHGTGGGAAGMNGAEAYKGDSVVNGGGSRPDGSSASGSSGSVSKTSKSGGRGGLRHLHR